MDGSNVPKPTVKRLAIYYRCVEKLMEKGKESVSSQDIALKLGLKASQVRKDLSYFGEFGKRGVGYDTESLFDNIGEILGMKRRWNVCIVGIGNLGLALANYPALTRSGFYVKALLDNDTNKIGIPMPGDLYIEDVKDMKEIIKKRNIDVGVITVTADNAQTSVDKLVESGIKGIINFAPVKLAVPKSVKLEEIDISVAFRSLAFQINLSSR